jgi:hypothetical protein
VKERRLPVRPRSTCRREHERPRRHVAGAAGQASNSVPAPARAAGGGRDGAEAGGQGLDQTALEREQPATGEPAPTLADRPRTTCQRQRERWAAGGRRQGAEAGGQASIKLHARARAAGDQRASADAGSQPSNDAPAPARAVGRWRQGAEAGGQGLDQTAREREEPATGETAPKLAVKPRSTRRRERERPGRHGARADGQAPINAPPQAQAARTTRRPS